MYGDGFIRRRALYAASGSTCASAENFWDGTACIISPLFI